jgi:organic hydroperoxide reductase OsmC/OhrA
MSHYHAKIIWNRNKDDAYIDHKYSRGHTWSFDGGVTVPATASPHIVPLPYSVAENVDPEQAFVASLSSCHMLFFLDIAARKGLIIDNYTDNAVGIMGKNEDGKIAMTIVTLRPKISFSGDQKPSFKTLEELHHKAHELCFIANSVKTEVVTEIVR